MGTASIPPTPLESLAERVAQLEKDVDRLETAQRQIMESLQQLLADKPTSSRQRIEAAHKSLHKVIYDASFPAEGWQCRELIAARANLAKVLEQTE